MKNRNSLKSVKTLQTIPQRLTLGIAALISGAAPVISAHAGFPGPLQPLHCMDGTFFYESMSLGLENPDELGSPAVIRFTRSAMLDILQDRSAIQIRGLTPEFKAIPLQTLSDLTGRPEDQSPIGSLFLVTDQENVIQDSTRDFRLVALDSHALGGSRQVGSSVKLVVNGKAPPIDAPLSSTQSLTFSGSAHFRTTKVVRVTVEGDDSRPFFEGDARILLDQALPNGVKSIDVEYRAPRGWCAGS